MNLNKNTQYDLDGRLFYKPIEVAQLLGMSLSYVRNQIRNGNIEADYFGRSRRIYKHSLQNFIKKITGKE